MSVMKLKIAPLRVVVMWLIVLVAIAGIILLSFTSIFFTKWGLLQIMITVGYVAIMVMILIFALNGYYYIIEKDRLIVKKFNKELIFPYKNIVYIDEEESIKTKIVTMVTNRGDVIYLNFDKKGILFKTLVEKCKNVTTKEEAKRKYPNAKI